ncbi:MAG TPA: hypothetical protein VGD37_42645 [Kofleriaceae bacterium]
MFAVIAAAAPARPAVHAIGPRAASTATDPPRLTAGYRAMRISLRRLAPDAGPALPAAAAAATAAPVAAAAAIPAAAAAPAATAAPATTAAAATAATAAPAAAPPLARVATRSPRLRW